MENEEVIEKSEFEELTAEQTWEKLYGKKLNCKKHILEYIEITRILKTESVSQEKIEETYHYIIESIDGLSDIKPNTMMHLKNTLNTQLGKFVKEDPDSINHFIEFFKLAYPEKKRRKEFTMVLMDLSVISADQVWTTLTYINREYISRNVKLTFEQKNDIKDVIKLSVSKNNIKFINKVRSLRQLTDYLRIRIDQTGNNFRVREI